MFSFSLSLCLPSHSSLLLALHTRTFIHSNQSPFHRESTSSICCLEPFYFACPFVFLSDRYYNSFRAAKLSAGHLTDLETLVLQVQEFVNNADAAHIQHASQLCVFSSQFSHALLPLAQFIRSLFDFSFFHSLSPLLSWFGFCRCVHDTLIPTADDRSETGILLFTDCNSFHSPSVGKRICFLDTNLFEKGYMRYAPN